MCVCVCVCVCVSVITGSTDGIGKCYALQVNINLDVALINFIKIILYESKMVFNKIYVYKFSLVVDLNKNEKTWPCNCQNQDLSFFILLNR